MFIRWIGPILCRFLFLIACGVFTGYFNIGRKIDEGAFYALTSAYAAIGSFLVAVIVLLGTVDSVSVERLRRIVGRQLRAKIALAISFSIMFSLMMAALPTFANEGWSVALFFGSMLIVFVDIAVIIPALVLSVDVGAGLEGGPTDYRGPVTDEERGEED